MLHRFWCDRFNINNLSEWEARSLYTVSPTKWLKHTVPPPPSGGTTILSELQR
ncbi:MAG: hypothetical protein ACHBN1_20445 [Heteroscytonema crispum UTEX LB 1556]